MRNKLFEIIKHYGVMHQLKYFQSEVFELNEAIINAENNRLIGICREPSDLAIEHIAEEIADCYVMLEQFRLFYDIDYLEIEEIMKKKINRQMERLKNE